MLLGFARGKVGDLVFSRSNGQQVTRAKATHIKNPQTETQMIQRIILNTIAQAYSRFSAICDHSFEGVQSGQKSVSYFMSKNMDLLRSRLAEDIAAGYDLGSIYAFSPINSNEYASNEYIIAKGTLPSVVVGFTSGANTAEFAVTANTYQGVIDALGLQRGDQLTFVTTQGTTGANTGFHYARIILSPTNADGSEADLSSPFIVDGAVNLPSPRNTGLFSTLDCDGSKVTFAFNSQPMSGAAVIVSRQNTNGTWLRSNATLAFDITAVAGWQLSMQECLDMFQSGGVDTLSSRYLNNAGTARIAGGGGSAIVTDVVGNTHTIVSYAVVDYGEYGIVEFTENNGNKMYARMVNTSSRVYGMLMSNAESYESQAWMAESSPATSASQIIGITGVDTDNVRALISLGISETVFVSNDGDSDAVVINSVKYGTASGQYVNDWPASGNIVLPANSTIYVQINGAHLTNSAVKLTRDGNNVSLTGSGATMTANSSSGGVYALTLWGYEYLGTVTIEASEP